MQKSYTVGHRTFVLDRARAEEALAAKRVVGGASPDLRAVSHMYRRAWHAGLKTTYYLRTLGASAIEKATVSAPAACAIDDPSCEACQ